MSPAPATSVQSLTLHLFSTGERIMGMSCFVTGILSLGNINVHRLVPSSQLFFLLSLRYMLHSMAVKVETNESSSSAGNLQ